MENIVHITLKWKGVEIWTIVTSNGHYKTLDFTYDISVQTLANLFPLHNSKDLASMSMSIGSVAPISQGKLPSPARPRPDGRPNPKVSFKLTKPKASKARYLTKSELSGIGMSIILSMLIALAIVFIGMKVAPIIFNFVFELLREIVLGDQNPSRLPQQSRADAVQPRKLSRFLTINNNINCSYFTKSVANKDALLFAAPSDGPQLVEQLFSNYASSIVQPLAIEAIEAFEAIENAQIGHASRVSALSMSLQEYREFEWSLNTQTGSNNHYLVDTSLLSSANLLSQLTTPSLPNSAGSDATCTLRNSPFRDFVPTSFSFGKNTSNLSGRGFHSHRRSVSVLLSGRKHWAIYAPDQVPTGGFNPLDNLHDWRTHTAPTLGDADHAPIEIVQEAGQAVYIPEGWYHATQTLSAESVSVRYQPSDEEAGQYYYYLVRGDQKVAAGDAAAAVKLYRLGLAIQKDSKLLSHLGRALEQMGLFVEAEETYKEAISRSPRDPFLYTLLINLFVSHSSKDASRGISELLNRAEEFELKSTVLELMKDSF